MKRLLLGFILIFSTYTLAAADDPSNCSHCKTDLRGDPSKSMGDAGKLMRAVANVQDEKIKLSGLASQLCLLYSQSKQIPTDAKKLIADYMKNNNHGQPTVANMIKFLNENKNDMHCGSGRNFVKEAIEFKAYKPMVYNFLIDGLVDDNEFVDFNAVDIVNGKPETVIDYIDNILADKQFQGTTYHAEVKELRNFLMDEEDGFGAKRFRDLPVSIRSQYPLDIASR